MIIEFFEDNKNKNITFNEDTGEFTIKNNQLGSNQFGGSLLRMFNLGNTHIFEKDCSINKINELRESSENTTLTKYDIDMLYEFAKLEFNYTKNENEFSNEPLKNVFTTLSSDKLMIHKLMPMSYDYLNAIKKGEKPIIEKFSGNYKVDKLGLTLFFLFVSLLFILYFLYLGCLCFFDKKIEL